ncbi:5'-3' exonuclease H3TH domain-containing protein [Verrucomicrobiota bacterium]
MASKNLILVDGMGLLYRAFYAIRDLSTKSGRPTNAVYGFIRMLRQVANVWDATHWVVVFDGGLPEERLELYKDYKAQRAPMPDPLRDQIGDAEEYLDRAGICMLRIEGQEADDVMASLAAWAEPEAERVLIATSDKDMYQVVNEKIHVVPGSGKKPAMGPGEVRGKTGVLPGQIVEWLALTGDAVDNIPGVPGVGAKTAAKLLNEYGGLDGIWENLAGIGREKLRRALGENRDTVSRNVEMVTLNRDLECGVDWDALQLRKPDAGRLLPFFEELEFEKMAGELREGDMFL